ncbi:MAG: zinc ABC transporter substrate-binding protein [bacterium]
MRLQVGLDERSDDVVERLPGPRDAIGAPAPTGFEPWPPLLALLLAAPALARVKVVATLPDLAALAAEVGGDAVEVTALVTPTQDPHYVDPRRRAMCWRSARRICWWSTGWSWRPPGSVPCASRPQPRCWRIRATWILHRVQRLGAAATVDRSQGDIHPGGNPHFTHDPRAGAAVAGLIAQRLAASIRPTQLPTPSARALQACLRALAEAQRVRFAALSADRRRIVALP